MTLLSVPGSNSSSSVLARRNLRIGSHIGSRIRIRREGLGISTEQVEEKTGLGLGRVAEGECGSPRFTAAEMFNIGATLSMSINDMFAD